MTYFCWYLPVPLLIRPCLLALIVSAEFTHSSLSLSLSPHFWLDELASYCSHCSPVLSLSLSLSLCVIVQRNCGVGYWWWHCCYALWSLTEKSWDKGNGALLTFLIFFLSVSMQAFCTDYALTTFNSHTFSKLSDNFPKAVFGCMNFRS